MNSEVKCPVCGSPMVRRLAKNGRNAGHYFYGCLRYPNCKGTRNIEDGLSGAMKNTASSEWARAAFSRNNQPYADPAKVNYPVRLTARGRAEGSRTIFMDTMAVPNGLFDNFIDNDEFKYKVMSFSKWRIDFAPTKEQLPLDKLAILSVIEKILNRGRVTKLSKDLEEKVLKLVENGTGAKYDEDAVLSSYRQYQAPNIPTERYDGKKQVKFGGMTAEEFFYKKIFIENVGAKFAKDVLPQVQLSSLVPDKKIAAKTVMQQRVDFLITHYDKSLAVEIDDQTRIEHCAKDASCDAVLSQSGLITYHVSIEDLAAQTGSVKRLLRKLHEMYGEAEDAGCNLDLIAVKLAHQFQMILVELLKSGKIDPAKQTKIWYLPSNVPFLQEMIVEKILRLALADLNELDENIAKIYQSKPLFSGILIDETEPDLIISVSDLREFPVEKIIYVQDFSFPLAIEQNIFEKLEPQLTMPDDAALRFLLNYIFGFPNFNPNQIDGIRMALSGKDAIVLLPTGSGKSVIYQLLSFISIGMTIVVDPIVSLIEDQVDNLNRRGIDRAVGISGNTKNRDAIQQAIFDGQYQLVFISPERLQTEQFRKMIKGFCVHHPIPVCAIDEAHCVSEWGHDFRTSYLNLAGTCRKLLRAGDKPPVILALTGTASEAVLKDMESDLGIPALAVVRPESFDRKEINFIVRAAKSDQKSRELERILMDDLPERFGVDRDDFFKPNGDKTYAGIIFCLHANGDFGVDKVAANVRAMGINTDIYSGKKPSKIILSKGETWEDAKRKTAKAYKDNDFPVLAATKSYGMGIDKPNIRYTIHYGLSQSIEAYYQEAGRAGRDWNTAYSYIIFSNDDRKRNAYLLQAGTELSELKKASSSRTNSDDVTRTLYFHAKTFSGIDGEIFEIEKVLKMIGDLNVTRKVTIKTDAMKRETTEKAIYRLTILGLVEDYTIDFSANEFQAEVLAIDRERTAVSFGEYFSKYNDDEKAVNNAEEKIRNIATNEPIEFMKKAAEVLLREHVYKTIEHSRRNALLNLVNMMDEAVKISSEHERSEYVRKEILKFLGNTHVDVIKIIQENPIGLSTAIAKVRSLKKSEVSGFISEISRMLEAYPDYPSLMLARLTAQMRLLRAEREAVLSQIHAISSTAFTIYDVSTSEMGKVLAEMVMVYPENSAEAEDLVYWLLNDEMLRENLPYLDAFVNNLLPRLAEIYRFIRIKKIVDENKKILKEEIWKTK